MRVGGGADALVCSKTKRFGKFQGVSSPEFIVATFEE